MQSRKHFFSCTIRCEEFVNDLRDDIQPSPLIASGHYFVARFPQLRYTQDLLFECVFLKLQGRLQALNPDFFSIRDQRSTVAGQQTILF
jgi:hypothetical protein